MKAVRFFPPGGPEKLKYQTEEDPTAPSTGEVLIKVHAVGLIWPELTWPIYQNTQGEYTTHIPGHDFSGIVTQLGPGCENSGIEVGSEVYAFTSRRNHEGAMAEFAKADVDQVILKPQTLSFVEAAAVPLSALTAWQALFDHGNLQRGQKLLVTAGAGGTGIFAVQFARMIGAHVIATGSSQRSRKILEGFAVDEFVDYKSTNLRAAVNEVDLVLDCVGGEVFEECLDVVKKNGLIVSINALDCEQKARERGIRGMFFIVSMNGEQLNEITRMIEDSIVKPVVDAEFPLEEAQAAFEEASAGHVHGKVVVKVA